MCNISWNCLTDRRGGLEQSYWGQVRGWIKYRKQLLEGSCQLTGQQGITRAGSGVELRVRETVCQLLRERLTLSTMDSFNLDWDTKGCAPGIRVHMKWEMQILNLWTFEYLSLWISESPQALIRTKWCQNVSVLRCDSFRRNTTSNYFYKWFCKYNAYKIIKTTRHSKRYMNENEQKQQTIETGPQGLQIFESSDTDFKITMLIMFKETDKIANW